MISDHAMDMWNRYCKETGETYDSVYKDKEKIQAFRDWYNPIMKAVIMVNSLHEEYMNSYIEILKYIGHYDE